MANLSCYTRLASNSHSDATMTNLVLININAKSSRSAYRSQVVLKLNSGLKPRRCANRLVLPHSTEQVPSETWQ